MKILVVILCLVSVLEISAQRKFFIGRGDPSQITLSVDTVYRKDTIFSVQRDTLRTLQVDTQYLVSLFDTTRTLISDTNGLAAIGVPLTHFGAVADDGLSDQAAFDAWLTDVKAGGNRVLLIPAGRFHLDTTFTIDEIVFIYGTGNQNWNPSLLQFDADSRGLHFTATTDGSILSGLSIFRMTKGANTLGDGLLAQGHGMLIERCQFENWGGCGINFSGGNTNTSTVRFCRAIRNGLSGFRAGGSDSNNITFLTCDATLNGLFGFEDDSFLGNTYVGCHTATNDSSAYTTTNINARSVYVGCYAEADQSPNSLATNATWLGGIAANGFVGAGTWYTSGGLWNELSAGYINGGAEYEYVVLGKDQDPRNLLYHQRTIAAEGPTKTWGLSYDLNGNYTTGGMTWLTEYSSHLLGLTSRDSSFKDDKVLFNQGMFLGNSGQATTYSRYLAYGTTEPAVSDNFRNGDRYFNANPNVAQNAPSGWYLVNGDWKEWIPVADEAGIIYTDGSGNYQFIAAPTSGGEYTLKWDTTTGAPKWDQP